MKNRPTADQFKGMLIGKAVGDALGAAVETQPPDTCRNYVAFYMSGSHLPFEGFGQYTDDTQLARLLCESIVAEKTFNGGHFAHLLSNFVAGEHLYRGGKTTGAAAANIKNGTPWQKAGITDRPTNGSCMRVAPIGLYYATSPESCAQTAYSQSNITHNTPEAQAACVAIATAVRLAATMAPFDHILFLEEVANAAGAYHKPFYDDCEKLHELIPYSPLRALELLLENTWDNKFNHKQEGISTHARQSSLWALYSFLHQAEHPIQTISIAISGGGDTDTTAAMAGAMAGARHGLDSLPQRYLPHLHDRGGWQTEKLAVLAEKLHGLSLLEKQNKMPASDDTTRESA